MPITSAIITGSGHYLPEHIVRNEDFLSHTFFGPDKWPLQKSNEHVTAQLEQITGIRERRYIGDELVASDIAFYAAQDALSSSGIDPEQLDYIIVAHNFGDVSATGHQSELVPALASRVKQHLGIINPAAVAYDLPFGCAGWLQGMIQADLYIRSGNARHVLVIGTETLSRVCDPHDRDSMIFADGAGAVLLSAIQTDKPSGILAHHAESHAGIADALHMGVSNDPADLSGRLFLKMNGRKVYEEVLKIVPHIIQSAMDKAGLPLERLNKLLIHQANDKMDRAVLRILFGTTDIPEGIMPMTISWLGNSSVATLPTLYDLIVKGKMAGQELHAGDIVAFSAVGAGLNANALIYQMPKK